MRAILLITNLLLIHVCSSLADAGEDASTFPPNFFFGTATAAYQIEGAWNISDKGEGIWDHYTHYHPEKIWNGDTADVACDSYNKYKEDVKLMKEMGLTHYRFSISWPRVLPTGYANVVSKDGIKYYHDLLDELEKNGITPSITLYHWNHPQLFQEMGGWTNRQMVDLFGDYARVIFKEFGHRVKTFYTINEPSIVCENGYYLGTQAPGLKAGRHLEYLCSHNILKAHARAYHIYDDEFRPQQKGQIGIVLNCVHHFAKHENDKESEDVAFQFLCGRFAHPIHSKTGDYPEILKKRVAENSKFEGLRRSRLPRFSREWIDYIKGTSDFFALNHYTTQLVEPAPRGKDTVYVNDDGLIRTYDPDWTETFMEGNYIVPGGFRALLKKIKEEYDNPPIMITENGVAGEDEYEDNMKIQYLSSYMQAMLTAIKEDGVNVIGYYLWSLLDNFEWQYGYAMKFGVHKVDYNDPNRKRTPRKSAHWFKKVVHSRKLQPLD